MNKILLFLLFGLFLSSAVKAQTDSVAADKVYTAVQVIPSFPGGMEAFHRFLAKNIRYPATAFESHKQGKVILTFVVEKDGSLTEMKIKKGIGYGCDEEAMRVIKLSSPWQPGTQGGNPVRVAYSLPVSFALAN